MSFRNIFPGLILFLAAFGTANATSYVSNVNNGAWNNPTTWLPNGIPGGADDVTISNGFNINLTDNRSVNNMTFTGAASLTVNTNNVTLSILGNVITSGGSGASAFIGGGINRTVTVAGSVTIAATDTHTIGGVTYTQNAGSTFTASGTMAFNNTTGAKTLGNLVINSTGSWSNTTAGTSVTIQGNMTMNDGASITATQTPTIVVNGSFNTNATVAGNKSSIGNSTISVTGTSTINGYLVFTSATGTKTFSNTITVGPGATWDNSIGQSVTINCSIVSRGSWVDLGSGAYVVSSNGQAYTYSNGAISRPIVMGTLTISGTSTVTNMTPLELAGTPTALTVSGGGTFFNGTGAETPVLTLSACTTCVSLSGGGAVNFTRTGNTVDFSSTTGATQQIPGTTYYNLTASGSNQKRLAAAAAVTNLVTTSGSAQLYDFGFALTGAANLTQTGTSNFRSNVGGGATLPQLTGATNNLGATTSMTFQGTSYTLKSSATYPYKTININGGTANFSNVSNIAVDLNVNGGTIGNNPVMTIVGSLNYASSGNTSTLANSITVGSLNNYGGTINYSGVTITVNGNNGVWNLVNGAPGPSTAAFTTNATSTVVFTTGTNQQITSFYLGGPGTSVTTFQNLTMNNANGLTLAGVGANVAGTLTLTNGNINTGSNTLAITGTGTVSRTSGFVDGNLQKPVALGSPSVTYEVGDVATYTPVTLAFTTVGTAGSVTVSNTSGQHPSIGSSALNPSKDVARYWSILNTGTAFTSYNATFNFVAGDVIGGANTAIFQINRFNPTTLTWGGTTAGTRNATNTQFTGELSANLPSGTTMAFAIGEVISTTGIFSVQTGNWSNKATWIQNRTGTVTFSNATTTVNGVGTAFLTELVVGDVLILQATPTVVRGTVASITSNTVLILSAIPGANSNGAYGRQYVPNTINDVVTIGNTANAPGAHTITLDMNATVNSLGINTVTPQAVAQVLTHSGTNSLTVQSNVSIAHPTAAVTNAWNINAGSATLGGSLTLGSASAGTTTAVAQTNITTGTLTVTDIIFNTANTASHELTSFLNMAGSTGTVNFKGAMAFTNTRGLLKGGSSGSNFIFNGTSAQTMLLPTGNQAANTWVYNNVAFNNAAGVTYRGSATGTLAIAAANLTGNFAVQAGRFLLTGTGVSITGSGGATVFSVASGAFFRMTGNKTLPGSFGSYSFNINSTTEYNQPVNGGIAVPNNAYGNLVFNPASTSNSTTFSFATGAVSCNNISIGDGVSNYIVTVRGTTATALTIANDLTITGYCGLSTSGVASIAIAGDWIDNGISGAFSDGAATVTFNGSGTQVISSTEGNTDSFNNLVINTAAATNTVQLQQTSISVGNVLTLTRGALDLNGNTVNVTSNATGAITRTNGFVKSETTASPYGNLVWRIGTGAGSYVFPFGKSSTEYIPFTFNVTASGVVGSSTGDVSVATYPTATNNTPFPSGVTNINGSSNGLSVVDRFWIVTPKYATTMPTANATFVVLNTEVATVSPGPPLNAQRWSPAGYWDAALAAPVTQTYTANTPAANTSQVLVSNLSQSVSIWTLTSTSQPLPIQLVSFTAIAKDYGVEVRWKTATEVNNDYFTVMYSPTGTDFIPVGNVKGNGTTTTEHSYSFTHLHPVIGRNYYQLKQTDTNGKAAFSEIILVNVETLEAPVKLYPNPVAQGGVLNLEIYGLTPGLTFPVMILSAQGLVMERASGTSDENGTFQASIPVAAYSPGVYVVTVQGVRMRFIVNK